MIGPIINLFIGGTIIYYLHHLENIGCKCSLTFQRNYIYYYTIAIFIFNLISIFFQDKLKNLNLILFLPIVVIIAGIINIVYTIEYVQDMKKQNCECSESFIRDLMFIIAILQISAFIIVILTIASIIGFKLDMNKYILNSNYPLRKIRNKK